ncbi:lytic murein transglycosylase [Salmonella enterica subsp. enterica serovar Daytona]|uniref:Lytic murein transglycosylase n=1 Tax=Salmonella enterica subsp. enterica serovar Daytona TaxID=1962639 RepID=A0A447JP06_SALET|nr:lytic murein transglycosylase [Salmonella enterica subsp. enterica serovar Daytona]
MKTGAACWRLARRKPGTTEAQCNYYYAKWSTGQTEAAWQGAKDLWLTGKSQPNACDKLFSVWRASGKQDPLAYLERIRLAMKAGNTGLVTVLADRCRRNIKRSPQRSLPLANDPNNVLTFARTTGATDFTRQMAEVAFASVRPPGRGKCASDDPLAGTGAET